MTTIPIKRGATFRHALVLSDDFDGWAATAVTAEIRTAETPRGGGFVRRLEARKLDDRPGWVEISAATDDWPLALLATDVRATLPDGEAWATATFHINVTPEVTRE